MATTEPGVYTMSDVDYHADEALSSSGARMLLPPSCPARFRYERDNPPEPKPHFDLGHAAHKEALGVGMDYVVVQADDWRSKAAQQARKTAHAEGKIPLLAAEHEQVKAMAAKLREHPIASALLDPESGKPEQSLFWRDERYGVMRRARIDWLREADANGRLIVVDYKSTVCAEPRSFAKSMSNYGYHAQGGWYADAVLALGLAETAPFVLIAQEKTAPYLVSVYEPDAEALREGRAMNNRALEVFAECTATDTWPGYTSDVELISLPPWAVTYSQGAFA